MDSLQSVKLDKFTTAYLVAALWSSTGDGGEPLDSRYSISDFSPAAIENAIKDCAAFRSDAGGLLEEWDEEQAGHDFWLTRCGHGAGFWARGIATGESLSRLVGHGTKYPNLDLSVGDDGKIYGVGESIEPAPAELLSCR